MLSEALPGKGKVPAVTSLEPVRKIREQDQNGPECDALAVSRGREGLRCLQNGVFMGKREN